MWDFEILYNMILNDIFVDCFLLESIYEFGILK